MNMVIAIVVCYNSDSVLLAKQNEALRKQVDNIIYIDNGSPEKNFIKAIPKEFTVIGNDKNIGLGAAQNQGIKEAIRREATHILLMDDDSVPSEDMVSKLLNEENLLLRQGHNVGLIGALVKNEYTGMCNISGIRFIGLRIKRIQISDYPISVSYCIASGSLIRTEVIKSVGLINEPMFIDNLDLEWCLRAKDEGYEIFASPSAILNHRLGNGSKDKIRSHSPMREYYILRNSIALVKMKHIPLGFRVRKFTLSFLRLSKSVLRGNKAYAISGLRGIYDGFKTDFNK